MIIFVIFVFLYHEIQEEYKIVALIVFYFGSVSIILREFKKLERKLDYESVVKINNDDM